MSSRVALSIIIAATTLISFQSAAMASDTTTIRDHRTKVETRDHRKTTTVRDHRTRNVIRDHRSQRKNEVVVVKAKKFSCGTGFERLRRTGFRSIQIVDCAGVKYRYQAHRNNKIYNADMNAFSGRIQVTMAGFAH